MRALTSGSGSEAARIDGKEAALVSRARAGRTARRVEEAAEGGHATPAGDPINLPHELGTVREPQRKGLRDHGFEFVRTRDRREVHQGPSGRRDRDAVAEAAFMWAEQRGVHRDPPVAGEAPPETAMSMAAVSAG